MSHPVHAVELREIWRIHLCPRRRVREVTARRCRCPRRRWSDCGCRWRPATAAGNARAFRLPDSTLYPVEYSRVVHIEWLVRIKTAHTGDRSRPCRLIANRSRVSAAHLIDALAVIDSLQHPGLRASAISPIAEDRVSFSVNADLPWRIARLDVAGIVVAIAARAPRPLPSY